MDVITAYKRYENETDEELIYRICSEKEIIGTWNDVAGILNELLSQEYTESKYRKQFQAFQKMLSANQSKFVSTDSQLEEINLAKRELERAKIQFRDQRNAWSKQNYIDARAESKLDLLEDALMSQGKINFEIHDKPQITSDNDILIMLTDFHIGQTFKSVWGEYNTDIAAKRLDQLFNEVVRIQKIHNSQKCYIALCGDIISGSIHKSIQVTNRENVIEQIKIATELISSFCYCISKHFSNVFMLSVVGNHSRIDVKDDALHDERLDDIIAWAVNLSLKHIDNFAYLKRNLDVGIGEFDIRGKYYTFVHGDYDKFNKSGISNLCMYLGYTPYAVCMGHLHTCAVDETNGVKMIRGGSLAGSGDQYTLEKRLSGKPSQMVCVCNDKGVECYYPIELN